MPRAKDQFEPYFGITRTLAAGTGECELAKWIRASRSIDIPACTSVSAGRRRWCPRSPRAPWRGSRYPVCDHSDVMPVRSPGCVWLHRTIGKGDGVGARVTKGVAEVAAHSLFYSSTARAPHVSPCAPASYSGVKSLVPWDEFREPRSRGLDPRHPIVRDPDRIRRPMPVRSGTEQVLQAAVSGSRPAAHNQNCA